MIIVPSPLKHVFAVLVNVFYIRIVEVAGDCGSHHYHVCASDAGELGISDSQRKSSSC